MKIGLVSLFGNFNFGNKLQNYALQEAIKKLNNNISVITIVVDKQKSTIKKIISKFAFNDKGKKSLKSIGDIRREEKIRKFSNKYIVTKKYNKEDIYNDSVNSEFDIFVVGSDQVWNPSFWRKDYNAFEFYLYLLKFAEKSKKNSYSASFGISQLPIYWEKYFTIELNEFNSISVRENEGQKIIFDLLNRKVPVTIDPTKHRETIY